MIHRYWSRILFLKKNLKKSLVSVGLLRKSLAEETLTWRWQRKRNLYKVYYKIEFRVSHFFCFLFFSVCNGFVVDCSVSQHACVRAAYSQ